MHGLGADGHDFETVVPELVRPGERALRFVLPHAPVRPVTINGGMSMRAWYDIVGFQRNVAQDETGIRASVAAITALMKRENERGVATERIVLAGFSQGGALALFTGTRATEKLAGIIGLSCYMLLGAKFAAERRVENLSTPIFLAHGTRDPVVDVSLGEETRVMLQEAGYPVTWQRYPIPHSVSPEELTHIAVWLRRVL
jgi:phospholipase/carboxylesterase